MCGWGRVCGAGFVIGGEVLRSLEARQLFRLVCALDCIMVIYTAVLAVCCFMTLFNIDLLSFKHN